MAWFKVDDGFWSHPKTLALSAEAVALWVRAGAYSCQHLTDGIVHEPVLRLLGSDAAAVELVDAGLWLPHDSGWSFHDWGEYQETSETVKKRRNDARERQRRAREVAAEKRRKSRDVSHVTGGVTDGVSNGVSSLYPTRPDPTRPDPIDTEEPKGSSVSEIADAIRPDVKALLDLLDAELTANEVRKLPKRNKTNIDAMRLLIDKDGYEPEQVARIIRWCQSNSFWRGNIMSASKLRDKFEQLRAHANREREERKAQPSKADEAHDFISRLEAIDAVSGGGEAARDYPQLRQ